jgi:hypothetical protein
MADRVVNIWEHYRGFKDVKQLMKESFNSDDNIYSTALDILSLYLRGQKILYTESKIYCEVYLYRLMLPEILISTACSAVSGVMKDNEIASIVVCGLAAFNSFLLTIITYLKLDAKVEAHKTAANSFEKLQTLCEFNSGKILLTDKEDNMKICHDTLYMIEEKFAEVKEKNQFLIPEAVRINYPVLTSTNIFSELKQIQNRELILLNDLKVIMNEGADLQRRVDTGDDINTIIGMRDLHYKKKNDAINGVIAFRQNYYTLDQKFRTEIDQNIAKKRGACCRCCTWLKT